MPRHYRCGYTPRQIATDPAAAQFATRFAAADAAIADEPWDWRVLVKWTRTPRHLTAADRAHLAAIAAWCHAAGITRAPPPELVRLVASDDPAFARHWAGLSDDEVLGFVRGMRSWDAAGGSSFFCDGRLACAEFRATRVAPADVVLDGDAIRRWLRRHRRAVLARISAHGPPYWDILDEDEWILDGGALRVVARPRSDPPVADEDDRGSWEAVVEVVGSAAPGA